MKSIFKKIHHFWEWYIIWYLIDKPKDIYKTIRHWWKCNGLNPYHWKLIWYAAFHHYGWDNNFNLEITRLCILKSKYYFERHQYISDIHRNRILMWQKIAIGLLDIILEKREMWDLTTDNEYKCLIYVNQKNINRFTATGVDYTTGKIISSTNLFKIEAHELYKAKALKLLTKIMESYAGEWWD